MFILLKNKDVKVYYEPVSQFIQSYYGNEIIENKISSSQPQKQNTKKSLNKQKAIERKITKLEEKLADLEYKLYKTNDANELELFNQEIKKLKKSN